MSLVFNKDEVALPTPLILLVALSDSLNVQIGHSLPLLAAPVRVLLVTDRNLRVLIQLTVSAQGLLTCIVEFVDVA